MLHVPGYMWLQILTDQHRRAAQSPNISCPHPPFTLDTCCRLHIWKQSLWIHTESWIGLAVSKVDLPTLDNEYLSLLWQNLGMAMICNNKAGKRFKMAAKSCNLTRHYVQKWGCDSPEDAFNTTFSDMMSRSI